MKSIKFKDDEGYLLVAVFLLSSQILCGQWLKVKDLRKQTTAEEKVGIQEPFLV